MTQVEMCRETLMTLSLTDAENANLDAAHIREKVERKETQVETQAEEAIETTQGIGGTEHTDEDRGKTDEDRGKTDEDRGKTDEDRGKIRTLDSVECDSTGNSTDDQAFGDVAAMSTTTDDSDHEVCSEPLPLTPDSPDENANKK